MGVCISIFLSCKLSDFRAGACIGVHKFTAGPRGGAERILGVQSNIRKFNINNYISFITYLFNSLRLWGFEISFSGSCWNILFATACNEFLPPRNQLYTLHAGVIFIWKLNKSLKYFEIRRPRFPNVVDILRITYIKFCIELLFRRISVIRVSLVL